MKNNYKISEDVMVELNEVEVLLSFMKSLGMIVKGVS